MTDNHPLLHSPATCLVVYGSLAPGEANHHVISHIRGQWLECVITGTITTAGGYKVLHCGPGGVPIPARLFLSEELPSYWDALDEFEGDGYRRVLIHAFVGEADVMANVYVAAGPP